MHHAHIDKFAYQDSCIHRLDSRIKFLAVLIFSMVVISLGRTSLSILVCCVTWPFTVLVLARIPLGFALKQIFIVSPFVLVLALSCPLYDKTPVSVAFGPFLLEVTVGWMRCFVIIGKFVVTMLALIALVSTTRFADLLDGLRRMGFPKVLVVQLGFLYRYIFILIDRAGHILRARAGRKLRRLPVKTELQVVSSMLGSLFVRSIDTAGRVNIAMEARGFDGKWRSLSRLRIRFYDLLFVLVTAIFVLVLYFFVQPFLG